MQKVGIITVPFFILKRKLALDFQEIHLFRPNIKTDFHIHFLIFTTCLQDGYHQSVTDKELRLG